MDYKEKQKMYRDMYKQSGKIVWVSREKGDIKGRTYVKKDEELKKLTAELDKKKEEDKKNNG